jgi:peptidoglycan hydrolase-like protein with peptidoglycan-binding domain
MQKVFSYTRNVLLVLGLLAGSFFGFQSLFVSAEGPIEISTCAELQLIGSDPVEYPDDADYVLTQNIDCLDTVNWNDGDGFDPIGRSDFIFIGTLNGAGFTINNLFVDRDTDNNGLFGRVGNGFHLFNLILEDVNIGRGGKTGGVIGDMQGGLVEDVIVHGSVFVDSGDYETGGFVGYMRGSSVIRRSLANVSVVKNDSAEVGGFVGYTSGNPMILESVALGDVVSNSDEVGGFVGRHNDGTIINSYAHGNVEGDSDVGGFAGRVGAGIIANSYSIGLVIGNSDVGGFVGRNSGAVRSSFWDNQTSSQINSDGGAGLSTAQMKMQSTFTDVAWDFDDVWGINAGLNGGYPFLQWQELEEEIFELLSLSPTGIAQTSAVLRGQIVSGYFPEGALGFALALSSFDDLEDEPTLIGPADDFGTIDEESGVYTLDLSIYFAEAEYRQLESLECGTEYYYLAIGYTTVGEDDLVYADNEISFTTLPCDEEGESLYYMIRQNIAPGTYWTSVKTSLDGNTLVATGFNSLSETLESFAYISHDGGETWEHRGTFPGIFITSVGITNNDGLIFALGFNFGFDEEGEFMILLGTEDGGENWMMAPLYISLDEFDFFSEMDWILFSRISVGDNFSHVYISILDKLFTIHNGGETWDIIFDLEGSGIISSFATSQNGQKILATEAFNEFGGRVFFSNDYGQTGGVVLDMGDLDGHMPFSSAMSPDGMRMFVTTVSSDMHMSLDGGETWTITTNPDGYGWMYVMPSTAGSKIIASALDYENGKIVIYFSNDNGATWVKQDDISLSIQDEEYFGFLPFAVGNISGSQNLSRLGLVTFLELFMIIQGVPDLPEPLTPSTPPTPTPRRSSGGQVSPAMLQKLGITTNTEPNNTTQIQALMARVAELQAMLAQLTAAGTDVQSPVDSDPLVCSPLLKRGMRSNEVLKLQKRLGVKPESGLFASITENAVRAFQTEKGILVDGVAGPQTCALL